MEGRFWKIGDFTFDVLTRCLCSAGKQIQLGRYEGKLLAFLIEKHGTDYKIKHIEDDVWEQDKVEGANVHTRTSNLRKAFGNVADHYISRNERPVRLIKEPQRLPSWYRPDASDERLRLTPNDPDDDPPARQLWLNATSHVHNRALHDLEWAWILPFLAPARIAEFSLSYREGGPRYEDTMPTLAAKALRSWCDAKNKTNPKAVARLQEEPLGLQVRLVGVRFAHFPRQGYAIDLAPAKFLHYVAIQQNLWSPELHELRQYAFENALYGINEEVPLMLPSTFAVHMAAVSKDGKALLRQRSGTTPLYPLAWEAGPGELMHGPEYTKSGLLHHDKSQEDFPHFNAKGEPDLSLYLRNTVFEELSYSGAKDEDFSIYGLAVEYRTLAPKLMVVYQSDAVIDELVSGAKRSPERPHDVSVIELSADGIAKSFTDGRYQTWGPTSKLALLLALTQTAGEAQVEEVQDRMDKLDVFPTL